MAQNSIELKTSPTVNAIQSTNLIFLAHFTRYTGSFMICLHVLIYILIEVQYSITSST